MSDYVSGLPNADQLLDMVAEGQEQRETKASQGQFFYPDVSDSGDVLGLF